MSTAQQHPWPRPRSTSRAKRHRTMGALLVLLGLVGGMAVVLTGFLGPPGVARADTTPDNNDNPYFTLTMSPSATQNLVDGQAMPFTVTRTALGTSTGLEIAAVGTGWCASDVQLPVSQDPGDQGFDRWTTGFPLVNAATAGAPPLNCLDYVNSDLSSIVASGTSLPAIVPQPNTTTNVGWHGRRLPDGERPALRPRSARVDSSRCLGTTFRSTACPVSRARSPLPSGRRMCLLQVSKTSTSWGFLPPSSTRRPAWPAMVRHPARSPARVPIVSASP